MFVPGFVTVLCVLSSLAIILLGESSLAIILPGESSLAIILLWESSLLYFNCTLTFTCLSLFGFAHMYLSQSAMDLPTGGLEVMIFEWF